MEIKYRTYLKAQPPRPTRIKVGGWSGAPDKMVDGSEPQPWHCLPFTEGSTYGLELVYEYDNECHVINDNGRVYFDWDYAGEPGCQLNGSEFITFFPKDAVKYYAFNTSIDIVPPAGHVVRTEPHPRFFTDDNFTTPLSLIGNVQNEWWPKKFFVVFRAPPPGGRHIFRKGEPYVQLIFVPKRAGYETTILPDAEAEARRELEQQIIVSSTSIAKNVWRNPAAYAFNDHYKVLARAFERDGIEGVRVAASEGMKKLGESLPTEKSIDESMQMGIELDANRKFREAFAVFNSVLQRDPNHAEAAGRMGVIAASNEKPTLALELFQRSLENDPNAPWIHSNLGELYRRLGRFVEAEHSLRTADKLKPNDPLIQSNLALTLAQQNHLDAALDLCRRAFGAAPKSAIVLHRMGLIHTLRNEPGEASAALQRARSLDPTLEDAQKALNELTA